METRAHGTLVDVLGVGTLLLGPSGIGKSECALELVARGHRLVADDVVLLRRTAEGGLVGRAPELIRHYMEIRGIGLLYVPELFGADAVSSEAALGLVCRLERWREDASYERVGLDRPTETLAGVEVPAVVLPVRPAGNMATLVEVVVRDHRHRRHGLSAAARLDAQLREEMGRA